jgi:hypothetical protein
MFGALHRTEPAPPVEAGWIQMELAHGMVVASKIKKTIFEPRHVLGFFNRLDTSCFGHILFYRKVNSDHSIKRRIYGSP